MPERYIDPAVTVEDRTMSPPCTYFRLVIAPHRRGVSFWQARRVRQSLHGGAGIDSPPRAV